MLKPETNACCASGWTIRRVFSVNASLGVGDGAGKALVAAHRFGYVRSPMRLPDGLSTISLLVEGFALALPDSSWLCRLKEINAVHLQNEIFILPEQISGTLQVLPRKAAMRQRLGLGRGAAVATGLLFSRG